MSTKGDGEEEDEEDAGEVKLCDSGTFWVPSLASRVDDPPWGGIASRSRTLIYFFCVPGQWTLALPE